MKRNSFLSMPPLMAAVAAGKIAAMVMGLIVFFVLPYLVDDISYRDRWAILFWYITLGAVVGMASFWKRDFLTNVRISWWLRGSWMGAWMNFMIVLLASDRIRDFVMVIHVSGDAWSSPYWFVVDGVIIGLVAGYFSSKVERQCSTKSHGS